MAKKPVTHRTITKPIYPALGTIASAKVMNEAEHNGTFAIEVMFAALKHRESGKQITAARTTQGTLMTATTENGGCVTILAEESQFFPQISKDYSGRSKAA